MTKETVDEPSQNNEKTGDGVLVPEDFQKATHAFMGSVKSKHHVAHVRDRLSERDNELMKAEDAKNKKDSGKGDKNTPNFTVENGPSGLSEPS